MKFYVENLRTKDLDNSKTLVHFSYESQVLALVIPRVADVSLSDLINRATLFLHIIVIVITRITQPRFLVQKQADISLIIQIMSRLSCNLAAVLGYDSNTLSIEVPLGGIIYQSGCSSNCSLSALQGLKDYLFSGVRRRLECTTSLALGGLGTGDCSACIFLI